MPSSLLFAINTEGRVFALSTTGTRWREITYIGLGFKYLSAVPHFLWAVGGDRQIYVHVHGLDIPIRMKEESYENERWLPLEGFSGRLLPTDRYHFSSQDGSKDRSFDKIRLPSMAWQWEGEWHLETSLDGQPLDHDAWTYAVDFPATYFPKKQWKSCVRRRKWIRYRRYSAQNSWCAIAPLHKDPTQEPFIDVAVGGQDIPGGVPGELLVWAITAHGRVMFRTNVSTISPEGVRWMAISVPPGCEVTQISVGPTGLVWAILWSGRALVRSGVTRDNPTGEFWLEISPPEDLKLAQVSVGVNAVWATTRDNRVWFRKGIRGESAGTNDELARGSGWVEMVGNMALVTVAPNDQVWAVGNEDRCIYFRTGVSQSELTGKKWRRIHAPTQLSRTSSNASIFSFGGLRSSLRKAAREKRVRSWSSLSRPSSTLIEPQSLLQDWEETSRSAPTPTSLRLQGTPAQKGLDGTALKAKQLQNSEGDIINGKRSEEDLHSSDQSSNEMLNNVSVIKEHSEGQVTEISAPVYVDKGAADSVKKNPTAWSPIRSSGSVVGIEAHPETDGSAFHADISGDSGVFGEYDDEDDDDSFNSDSDMMWILVEAGACIVDPSYPPNWFSEGLSTAEVDMSKPWRVKILQELKRRLVREISGFDDYEKAVEMSSSVKTGHAKCLIKDCSSQYEDSVIELEWVGSNTGSLDSGTFTIMSPDRTQNKIQFSLSEITCVVCCSEPGHPRIAIHTPKISSKCSNPLKLEFSGDLEMEDWMANLTLVCCQMYGVHGSPSPGSIWITTNLGDVFVFDPLSLEASQLKGEMYSQELDVAGKATPYEAPLHNGFPPGAVIIVEGSIHEDALRFAINLQCILVSSSSKKCNDQRDVALHLNPRFDEGIIVRNSMSSGTWGEEEREGNMVLSQGSVFNITIVCEEDTFKISIDGKVFTYFSHRQKAQNVTHININGDVSLSRLVYQSKMVIVPPTDMFWRQMGGHLRRVETCSAAVTWGIGYDCTPFVYTGGWGGSFLKGLETSSSGINQMVDTHNYYVYENQRWNPLTGYSAHGLPTDRYMWSDVTGKYKRTKEKTKLLSMHWQWETDWCIDFHTPGGVDKEGWQYALDFPASFHGTKGFTDYVRRRRWVRKAKLCTSGPWQELGTTKVVNVSLQVYNDTDVDPQVDAWAVALNGDALYRNSVSSLCPAGVSWEHVPSDQPLASISCGANNQLWAVGRNGSAYWRFGITSSKRIGEVWETVEPPSGKSLKQISVGQIAVWALDSDGQLSVRKEVTPVFPEGTHWQSIPPPDLINTGKSDTCSKSGGNDGVGFKHVSAGPAQGEVWAITSTGVVCRRNGITADNPAGTGWTYGIGGNWQHVSARGCNNNNT